MPDSVSNVSSSCIIDMTAQQTLPFAALSNADQAGLAVLSDSDSLRTISEVQSEISVALQQVEQLGLFQAKTELIKTIMLALGAMGTTMTSYLLWKPAPWLFCLSSCNLTLLLSDMLCAQFALRERCENGHTATLTGDSVRHSAEFLLKLFRCPELIASRLAIWLSNAVRDALPYATLTANTLYTAQYPGALALVNQILVLIKLAIDYLANQIGGHSKTLEMRKCKTNADIVQSRTQLEAFLQQQNEAHVITIENQEKELALLREIIIDLNVDKSITQETLVQVISLVDEALLGVHQLKMIPVRVPDGDETCASPQVRNRADYPGVWRSPPAETGAVAQHLPF